MRDRWGWTLVAWVSMSGCVAPTDVTIDSDGSNGSRTDGTAMQLGSWCNP